MKKSLIIASASLAVVALSSCSTVISNSPACTVETEALIYNLSVADLEVQPQKVTATTSWSWNPFKKVSSYEAMAVAEALKESGADVLVEPVYEVKKRGLFRGGSVTVTGSPGHYTNFRPMTVADALIIKTFKGGPGVASPIISTTAPDLLNRLTSEEEQASSRNRFINILFGFPLGSDFSGGSFGAMYGRTGESWGWYGKLNIDWGTDDEGDRGTGFNITAGAIRKLPANFGLFAGIGLGVSPVESKFAFPLEVGVQWKISSFNIMVGVQELFSSPCLTKPFVGVGYCF